jgi:hypothetical protein
MPHVPRIHLYFPLTATSKKENNNKAHKFSVYKSKNVSEMIQIQKCFGKRYKSKNVSEKHANRKMFW